MALESEDSASTSNGNRHSASPLLPYHPTNRRNSSPYSLTTCTTKPLKVAEVKKFSKKLLNSADINGDETVDRVEFINAVEEYVEIESQRSRLASVPDTHTNVMDGLFSASCIVSPCMRPLISQTIHSLALTHSASFPGRTHAPLLSLVMISPPPRPLLRLLLLNFFLRSYS